MVSDFKSIVTASKCKSVTYTFGEPGILLVYLLLRECPVGSNSGPCLSEVVPCENI